MSFFDDFQSDISMSTNARAFVYKQEAHSLGNRWKQKRGRKKKKMESVVKENVEKEATIDREKVLA